MKVLFIGGTGIISSACSQLAVDRGIELYLMNRGRTDRPVPSGAHHLIADIRDQGTVDTVLADHTFDAVVQWLGYTREHVEADIALFQERARQYVFISSASAYQTPPASLPVTESTWLDNPYWSYSQNKIACEERLVQEYRLNGFPVTIVRPSHTYDRTLLPMHGGYTVVARMLQGRKVIVQGDGTSLWTLTHHRDFARGFVGLLGNSRAIGETYHITSDEWLTWNQIYQILAKVMGVEARLVHVPSDYIAAYDPDWGASLLGDKSHSMIFDNKKIRRAVPDFSPSIPFSVGAREILDWYQSDPGRQRIDTSFDELCDRIISAYETAWP